MQHFGHPLKISAHNFSFKHRHRIGHFFISLKVVFNFTSLIGKHALGRTRDAGEIKQEVVFQSRADPEIQKYRLNRNRSVAIKLKNIKSPESRRVLVLFAYRLFENIYFQLTRRFRGLMLAYGFAHIRKKGFKKCHGKTRRGAETGFGGKVGKGGYFKPLINSHFSQSFAKQRVFKFAGMFGNFGFGIFNNKPVKEMRLIYGNINKLINCGGYDSAGITAVKFFEVGPAPHKTYTQRRSSNYHVFD